jgi:hypothetical protein
VLFEIHSPQKVFSHTPVKIRYGLLLTSSLAPSAETATALPAERSNGRLYQGALAPLVDMFDVQPWNTDTFPETGADPFDFVSNMSLRESGSLTDALQNDWDSGYQSQSINGMMEMSLNYPPMFGFGI